jgi:sec-independent protein translocase protein TatB
MFNLGLSEMILIGIIALIFIGPKQLPEIARTIGRMLNELKRATDDITTSITNPEAYKKTRSFEEKQGLNRPESGSDLVANQIHEKPEQITNSSSSDLDSTVSKKTDEGHT